MSDAMRSGMLAHPSPIPVEKRRKGRRAEGVLWDAVAVFGPDARWEDTLPAPVYLDGDVEDVTPGLSAALAQLAPLRGMP
jgi:hypothetical protein